ncbi:AAA-like domain-containing protein [Chitinophaga eiseniae]|uniref:AAA-like domain-containing protein n=1 Tax=Chitinophaga eiseniae TaxID=634771 RepID=A0A1T4MKT6_9BACT|nr:conjugal transfer protein MobC [Chitinophaga eiseniae]SJZ67649.1 AAA-like domain-containing protein [Chitinophaga eiseniae]
MRTGENEQGLRKILDLTRLISIAVLVMHFYYYCYGAFHAWHWTAEITDRLLENISKTGLFSYFHKSKLISLGFLGITLLGAQGRKDEKIKYGTALAYMTCGLLLYFITYLIFLLPADALTRGTLYIGITAAGYILILTGGTLLSRVLKLKINHADIFNKESQSFPQEERLLTNEFSINIPATYQLKTRTRKSWINLINPMRGCLVCGQPGSGKTWYILENIIKQQIEKGYAQFIYDYKFPDLSQIAYNHFLRYKHRYKVPPQFNAIIFEDLSRTARCNPLEPAGMTDITDAAESARTILLGLNRTWLQRSGDFFVESPIIFVTAIIWYLRKYRNGEFCTLPHVVELMQVEYSKLFTLLRCEKEIEILISPFVTAFENDVMEQLEGQIAAAKIAMARLSSPELYFVLSGSDLSLDINNPDAPQILCMGNNPQKQTVYGAVLSLYINRLIKQINKKGKIKCGVNFEEFPTLTVNGIDALVGTGRSNLIATTIVIQNLDQVRKDYSREMADVLMNLCGNIICGQVSGDTAKQMSERIGKIMQERSSVTVNSSDTSVNHSQQLDLAVPASTISGLSSGEFVGIVADNPGQEIKQKVFYCRVQNDPAALKKEHDRYKDLPVVRNLDNNAVQQNYLQIKQDVQDIISAELERIINDPILSERIVKK